MPSACRLPAIYAVLSAAELLNHFGRYGYRLYDLARGIDERPVKAERERLQISTEITLPEDLSLAQVSSHLPHLAEDLWRQIERKNVEAKRRYPQTQNPPISALSRVR